MTRFLPVLACALALLPAARAATLAIAPSGTLAFTADYGGEPIEGQFKQFGGSIEYDPADPLRARFVVEVTTASVDTGDPERDGYLRGAEWFAPEQHPTARFVTRNDCSSFEGRLSCAGQLSLKGRTAPVTIEVQFSPDGKRLSGSTQLKRSTFAIGEGEWADPATIGDEVQVRFEVTLD